MSLIHIEDMIFIDEAGLNLAMSLRYGWAPIGERLIGRIPFKEGGRRASILAALDINGLLTEIVIEGYSNQAIFLDFIKDWLVPELAPGQVVIMDNLNQHKDPKVVAAIEAVGARVLFLSPYSPELNPIENTWSKLKQLIRKAAPRTFDALSGAIRDAVAAVTPQDARGWFAGCGYFEPCNTPI